jgi:hypothetical protein
MHDSYSEYTVKLANRCAANTPDHSIGLALNAWTEFWAVFFFVLTRDFDCRFPSDVFRISDFEWCTALNIANDIRPAPYIETAFAAFKALRDSVQRISSRWEKPKTRP